MAGRREELKQKFTKLTGLPAKKIFAIHACEEGYLDGRRMLSIADWEHAIAHIKKKLIDVDEEPTPVATQSESEEAKDKIRVAPTYELICSQPEYIAEAIALLEIERGNYKDLVFNLHPDQSALPEKYANTGFTILDRVNKEYGQNVRQRILTKEERKKRHNAKNAL
ncbi:MAG: hypothetical protein F6K55_37450 [Moorea sp. SIO4A3]|nr:hypothetical protein [Moorena sp. SIO4A3]